MKCTIILQNTLLCAMMVQVVPVSAAQRNTGGSWWKRWWTNKVVPYQQSQATQQLFTAVRSQDVNMMYKAVLANADVNAQDGAGKTPLHYAIGLDFVSRNNVSMVEFLLKNGAAPSIALQENEQRETPLHCIAWVQPFQTNEDEQIMNLLLQHMPAGTINSVNKEGTTPLDVAVWKQNRNKVYLLLSYGAQHGNQKFIREIYGKVDPEIKKLLKLALVTKTSPEDLAATIRQMRPEQRASAITMLRQRALYVGNTIESTRVLTLLGDIDAQKKLDAVYRTMDMRVPNVLTDLIIDYTS